MKKLYIKFLLLFLSGVFLAGCYTQIAVRDRDSGYYDSYEDEEEYYGDEYSDYSDTTYYEDYDKVEINNYYIGSGPLYRRYYWGYYPTFSIGFGYNYWYDPWCYDPWGWSNCIIGYPYYPYYSPYHYYGYGYYSYYGYYGGYYNDGWYWSGNKYRDRDRDLVSIRNNTGLRNSYGSRSTLSRTNNRDLNKPSVTSEVERNRTRVTSDRNRSTTVDKTRRETIDRTRRSGQNDTGRIREEKKRQEEPRVSPPVKRNETRREGVRQNRSTDRREVNKGNTGRRETVQKPRSSSPPQRTYSPPRTNSSPPRSSPPSRSGGSSGGSRSSGSDRRTR
jgi:hypothetical protein